MNFGLLAERRNVVLLGEPGAGKTSLFRDQAREHSARYLTVRSFLNLPIDNFEGRDNLFLDALDEKRAGRTDRSTVDALVQKLLTLRPQNVRISCRAADWLGETDLAALNDYFDANGGVVVVALDQLCADEQQQVLRSRGVEDASAFIRDAKSRGLDDLLGNPQNLLMLCDAVTHGGWPSSKRELYDKACLLLLSEQNPEHSETEGGRIGPEELLESAGGMFAIRLIGDAAGISITASRVNDDSPSARDLPVDSLEHVQASLCRRTFCQSDVPNVFDYVHRTVAEYLAARWLAKRVRNGLNIKWLLSLLGYDWKPASELRGLFAWMPVVLPEHASLFIDGDAFGVLSYGDPASLTASSRRYLLNALGALAEDDPWFRKGDWRKSVTWGLAGTDLIPDFEKILNDASGSFALRSIVLDSLDFGSRCEQLEPVLASIAGDHSRAYAEREDALRLLQKWNPTTSEKVFRSLGSSQDGLRLRSALLSAVPVWASPYDYATVINQAIRLPGRPSSFGNYWALGEGVPEAYLNDVVEAIRPPRRRRPDHHGSRTEIIGVIERLMARAISQPAGAPPSIVLKWLLKRYVMTERYGGSTGADRLRASICANVWMLDRLAHEVVSHVSSSHINAWDAWSRMRGATLGLVADRAIIEAGFALLESGVHVDRKTLFHYVAVVGLRSEGRLASEFLDRFDAAAHADPALQPIWDEVRVVNIPEWHIEDAERERRNRALHDAKMAKQCSDFDLAADRIASGEHLGWMTHLGKIYCGRFVGEGTPRARLAASLGEQRASIAELGLRAFAMRYEPDLEEVLALHKKGRHLPLWFGFMAGLDLSVVTEADYSRFEPRCIRAALAVDFLHPSMVTTDDDTGLAEFRWRSFALSQSPRLAVDVLEAILRVAIESQKRHLDGLYPLAHEARLGDAATRALRRILADYPDCSLDLLRTGLPAVLAGEWRGLARITHESYEACKASGLDVFASWWFGAGLILGGGEFESSWAEVNETPGLLWVLRDLGVAKRFGDEDERVRLRRLMATASFALRRYPMVEHPQGGWVGDQNAWDASEYVKKILAEIAASKDDQVSGYLASERSTAESQGYGDYLRHLFAEHRRQRVDAKFKQPDWREARDSLLNVVPANAASLAVLVADELRLFGRLVTGANTDVFKRFWNENSYGRVTEPKPEESARDALVDFLRPRFAARGFAIEPEGHMANDKRADVIALGGSLKAVVELKRHYHAEVWTAIAGQLDRFYTRDPATDGNGIYCVLWYGDDLPRRVPAVPSTVAAPRTAGDMEAALEALVPASDRARIQVVVIDVSGRS